MGRPPVKSSYKVEKAKTLARLQAEAEFYAKTFEQKKTLRQWIFVRINQMLEKVDPVEALAIVGATVFIKQGIEWSEEVLSKIAEGPDIPLLGVGFWWKFFGIVPDQPEVLKDRMDSLPAEVFQWLLSFCIATIIVRHPEAVMSLGGNIIGVAKGLLGMI